MTTRSNLVYRLLLVVWVVVVAWQSWEHHRVREQARSATIRRGRDISETLGLVVRSQRRFGGIVSKPRLESALKELLKSDELQSIALLNAGGDVVASAGNPTGVDLKEMPKGGVLWGDRAVTILNLVDLGTSEQHDGAPATPTIVLPDGGPPEGRREDWQRFMPPPGFRGRGTNASANTNGGASLAAASGTNAPGERDRPERRRSNFRRPPWMNEAEYQALIEEKGLHALAISISTQAYRMACVRDLWMRGVIGLFASVSVLGMGLAWKNQLTSSELQVRLVRASEMNSHLREMNVAAAGLAHEIRNPLNLISVMAQIIVKAPDASAEIRKKSSEIIDQVDHVTAGLNEFIHYSKPREVRRAPVVVGMVVDDVVRALKSDLEDKQIKLDLLVDPVTANADQQLLRQLLFNLFLNAVQAVASNGGIQIVVQKTPAGDAFLEVRDDGPGVPAEHQEEIFRPYFTTRESGTGLGLAVVKQIALLHGWDLKYQSNDDHGAVFRVSRIEIVESSAP